MMSFRWLRLKIEQERRLFLFARIIRLSPDGPYNLQLLNLNSKFAAFNYSQFAQLFLHSLQSSLIFRLSIHAKLSLAWAQPHHASRDHMEISYGIPKRHIS